MKIPYSNDLAGVCAIKVDWNVSDTAIDLPKNSLVLDIRNKWLVKMDDGETTNFKQIVLEDIT